MSTPSIPDPCDLFSEVVASPAPPDLTRPIMGRLGYMRVSPAVARRHRIQRAVRRAALVAGFGVLVAVAAFIHDRGPGARRPDGLTLPHALDHDMKGQQLQLRRTIRTIRSLPTRFVLPASPGEPVETGPEPLHEDVDRSAIGPMRWL